MSTLRPWNTTTRTPASRRDSPIITATVLTVPWHVASHLKHARPRSNEDQHSAPRPLATLPPSGAHYGPMNVGKTFYAKNRREWRAWLSKHHRTAPEIWLIYYKKLSGKPRIPYNHAVEEALCYGWIDSLLKPIDAVCWAQRYSPRKRTSRLSAMNLERVRRLIVAKRMTKAGLARIEHAFDQKKDAKQKVAWKVPAD